MMTQCCERVCNAAHLPARLVRSLFEHSLCLLYALGVPTVCLASCSTQLFCSTPDGVAPFAFSFRGLGVNPEMTISRKEAVVGIIAESFPNVSV